MTTATNDCHVAILGEFRRRLSAYERFRDFHTCCVEQQARGDELYQQLHDYWHLHQRTICQQDSDVRALPEAHNCTLSEQSEAAFFVKYVTEAMKAHVKS